ncbi:uncharacterized protein [Ambystoma mexicanum]|uniref:uncharacterized protein n=1 Tax=Ambystoma mexicanum TaxID=8296 RepID=UPI0037E79E0F
MYAADNAIRVIVQGTVIKRHAWLRKLDYRPEMQATLINMPVEPNMLFGKAVEEALKTAKDEYDTLKSLGQLTNKPSGQRGDGFEEKQLLQPYFRHTEFCEFQSQKNKSSKLVFSTMTSLNVDHYQKQISQNILQKVFRREGYKEEEALSCLRVTEDVCSEVIQRIITDLGHLALSLPYFTEGLKHYAPYLSVNEVNIHCCIEILTLESKAEVRRIGSEITDHMLEKVYSVIASKLQGEKCPYFSLRKETFLRTDSSNMISPKGMGKMGFSTVTEELIGHACDVLQTFIIFQLEEISMSQPRWKYVCNALSTFRRTNGTKIRVVPKTEHRKRNVLPTITTKPLIILPAFISTKDPVKLSAHASVTQSLLENYAEHLLCGILQVIENELNLETDQRTALCGNILPLPDITTASNIIRLLLRDVLSEWKQNSVSPKDQSFRAESTPLELVPSHTTEKSLELRSSDNAETVLQRNHDSVRIAPHNSTRFPPTLSTLEADKKHKSAKTPLKKIKFAKVTATEKREMDLGSRFPPTDMCSTTSEGKIGHSIFQTCGQRIMREDFKTASDIKTSSESITALPMKGTTETIFESEVLNSLEVDNAEEVLPESSKLDKLIKSNRLSCALDRRCANTPSINPENVSPLNPVNDALSQFRAPIKTDYNMQPVDFETSNIDWPYKDGELKQVSSLAEICRNLPLANGVTSQNVCTLKPKLPQFISCDFPQRSKYVFSNMPPKCLSVPSTHATSPNLPVEEVKLKQVLSSSPEIAKCRNPKDDVVQKIKYVHIRKQKQLSLPFEIILPNEELALEGGSKLSAECKPTPDAASPPSMPVGDVQMKPLLPSSVGTVECIHSVDFEGLKNTCILTPKRSELSFINCNKKHETIELGREVTKKCMSMIGLQQSYSSLPNEDVESKQVLTCSAGTDKTIHPVACVALKSKCVPTPAWTELTFGECNEEQRCMELASKKGGDCTDIKISVKSSHDFFEQMQQGRSISLGNSKTQLLSKADYQNWGFPADALRSAEFHHINLKDQCEMSLIKQGQYSFVGVYQASLLQDIIFGLLSKILFASANNVLFNGVVLPHDDELCELALTFLKSMLEYLTKLQIKIVKADETMFPPTELMDINNVVHVVSYNILQEFGTQQAVYTYLIHDSNIFAEKIINLVLKEISYLTLQRNVSEKCASYSYTELDNDYIIHRVIQEVIQCGNQWQALLLHINWLFTTTFLKDIVTKLRATLLQKPNNNMVIYAEAEFSETVKHLRHKVIQNISKDLHLNTNNSNIKQYLQIAVDIHKAVELVHRDIVHICKSPKAIEEALASKNETVTATIAKTLILELAHLQLSGEVTNISFIRSVENIALLPQKTVNCQQSEKVQELRFHAVYPASFVEDVISGLLCKIIFNSNCQLKEEDTPQNNLLAKAMECVNCLTGGLNNSPIEIVRVNNETQNLPNKGVVERVVGSVYLNVMKQYGSHAAVQNFIMNNDKVFADKLKCFLLAGFSDYHIEPSNLSDLSPDQYSGLEASNIIEKVKYNIQIRDEPCMKLTREKSVEFIKEVLVHLVSKLFRPFAEHNKCAEFQGMLTDSELNDVISKLLHALVNDIPNHDLPRTAVEIVNNLNLHEDIPNIVDAIYNTLLKTYGTQLAAQDKIKSGSKHTVEIILYHLMKVISGTNFAAVPKAKSLPSYLPSDLDDKPVLCCPNESQEKTEAMGHITVFSSLFVEEIISGIASKIFISIRHQIVQEKDVAQSQSHLHEIARSFINALLIEVDNAQVRVANLSEGKQNYPEILGHSVNAIVNCVFKKVFKEFGNDVSESFYRGLMGKSSVFVEKIVSLAKSEMLDYQLQRYVTHDLSLCSYTTLNANSIVSKVVNNVIQVHNKGSSSYDTDWKAPSTNIEAACSDKVGITVKQPIDEGEFRQPQSIVLSRTVLEEVVATFLIRLFFNCPSLAINSKDDNSVSRVKKVILSIFNELSVEIFEKQIQINEDIQETRKLHPKDVQVVVNVVDVVYSDIYQLYGTHWFICKQLMSKSTNLAQRVSRSLVAQMCTYRYHSYQSYGKLSDKYVASESSYFVERVFRGLSNFPPSSPPLQAIGHGLCAPILEEIASQFLTKILVCCNCDQTMTTNSNLLKAKLSKITSEFINTLLMKMIKNKMNVIKQAPQGGAFYHEQNTLITAVVDSVYTSALHKCGSAYKLFTAISCSGSSVSERIASLIIKEISKHQLQNFTASGVSCQSFPDAEISRMVENILTNVGTQSKRDVNIAKPADRTYSLDREKDEPVKVTDTKHQSIVQAQHQGSVDLAPDQHVEDRIIEAALCLGHSSDGLQSGEHYSNHEHPQRPNQSSAGGKKCISHVSYENRQNTRHLDSSKGLGPPAYNKEHDDYVACVTRSTKEPKAYSSREKGSQTSRTHSKQRGDTFPNGLSNKSTCKRCGGRNPADGSSKSVCHDCLVKSETHHSLTTWDSLEIGDSYGINIGFS